jgi:micrococcal nuclease
MKIPEFTFPSYVYKARLSKIVDGDTIDLYIDVGFKTYLHKRIRFLGIDTWELREEEKEAGHRAKDRLEELLNEGQIYVQTEWDGEGKYGRVLGWIWTVNEKSGERKLVNKILLDEGHGTEYMA